MKTNSGATAILSTTGKLLLLSIGTALVVTSIGCGEGPPRKAQAASVENKSVSVYPAEAQACKKVLLVHSYYNDYSWVDSVTQGVKRALAGEKVTLEILYMDTKRKTSEEWKREAGRRVREVTAEWRPDVVITVDDNAQEYFAKDYAGQTSPQFVFCGVNAAPGKYGFPASNITGVLERPHYAATVKQLRRLLPSVKRIAVITDDSPTSASVIEYIREQDADQSVISYEQPSTFDEWQAAILRCQDTADAIAVYVYHTVKRAGETDSMPPKEVMQWSVENSRIPIIGFLTFTVDDGALCGYLESGVEQGFRAGQITLEMLNGKSAADVPIVTALEGQSMLNMTTARKLGIAVPRAIIQTTDIVIGE